MDPHLFKFVWLPERLASVPSRRNKEMGLGQRKQKQTADKAILFMTRGDAKVTEGAKQSQF